jgi:SAM-dependent methyltransferase
MWDQRYSGDSYVYGTEPNEFLVSMFDKLPDGNLLCLGEGEGRNAVWLAQRGFAVTAVDASAVGLQKAQRLAKQRGTTITTVCADLADFPIGHEKWDVIVSIFCHMPPDLRRDVHRRCAEGLRPGGVMLLEAYTPKQLDYKTGGPPNAEMMMDGRVLREELPSLEFQLLKECVREVREGELHHGTGAIVQMLAVKPEVRT